MYIIDSELKIPLHLQLYDELKKDIIENYKVNDKLPSVRKICSEYNLSKNTVVSAYSQLVAEGYLEGIPKKGYFVADYNFSELKCQNDFELEDSCNEEENIKYDFFLARLAKSSFPLKLWKRLFVKALTNELDFGGYICAQGELGLREEIAKYLIDSRGVKCSADQIILGNGFADSLNTLARILIDTKEYKNFAIEDPGYYMARKVFEYYNFGMKKVPVDDNGIKIDELYKSKADIVYITPSHQFPTGVVTPYENRVELLAWAKETNSIIIEDDYDSEMNYTQRPIPSLQGLDQNDCVTYIGVFSKSFSPAIRVSYMILPRKLLPFYKLSYDANIAKVSLGTQKTLELFFKEGHWEKHLRKIRTINKKKHDLMKELILKHLKKSVKIESCGYGLSVIINPTVSFSFELLKQEAKKEKIKLYFTSERSNGIYQSIAMGFGGFELEEIPKAMKLFFKVWKKAIIH